MMNLKVLGVVALAALMSIPAGAVVLVPGGSVAPVELGTGPVGTLLGTISGSGSTSISNIPFDYTASVYDRDATAAVLLDFWYVFNVTGSGLDGLARMSATNFTGFTTDVFFHNTGGSVNPLTAGRTPSGATVSFDYGSAPTTVDPGETSSQLLIRTNATAFIPGTISFIDGGTADVKGFSPAAVPEPTSIFLFGSTLLGVGFAMRRRMRRQ
jgi:hypothetical protein